MKSITCLFLVLFLSAIPVLGAIIEGDVYTIDFSLAKTALVEINTMPKQQKVATNGHYIFEVPPGEYAVQAHLFEGKNLIGSTRESLNLSHEGTFTVDLVVFPEVEEENILSELEGLGEQGALTEIEDIPTENSQTWKWIFLLIVIVIAWIIWNIIKWKWMKKEVAKKKEELNKEKKEMIKIGLTEDDDLKNYVDYLKKEKRVTQKDMRKHFPDSEAKISLVLTELEAKGKIKKIKKGRGNIIIWNG